MTHRPHYSRHIVRVLAMLSVAVLACRPPQPAGVRAIPGHTAGFDRLRFLEGNWQRLNADASPRSTATGSTARFAIAPYLGGAFLRLQGTLGGPDFEIVFAYRAAEQRYALAILDAQSGVFDVYDGDFAPDGRLVLTNPEFFRIGLVPNGREGFDWVGSYSRDRGATWKQTTTFAMRRATSGAAGPRGGAPASSPATSSSSSTTSSSASADDTSAVAKGVARLGFLNGRWSAAVNGTTAPPGGRSVPLEFRPGLGNKYLELDYQASQGARRVVLSYYAAGKNYRLATLDAATGAMTLLTGQFDAEGRLVFTGPAQERVTFERASNGSVVWREDRSPDGGRSWQPTAVYRLSRA